jgi:diguanylate cyclase (GGDEF)-like protein
VTTTLAGKSGRLGERRRRGWRQAVYSFGPWAIGGAVVLFSILVVAYENRYRGAVRHEISNRLIYGQETTARIASQRLSEYLADTLTKLDLIAELGFPAGETSEEILRAVADHGVSRHFILSVALVDAAQVSDKLRCRMLFRDEGIDHAAADETKDRQCQVARGNELLAHLTAYRDDPDLKWHLGKTIPVMIGGQGHLLSVPIRDAEGHVSGLATAILPTGLDVAQLEKTVPEDGPKLWVLASDGEVLGERVAPAPSSTEVWPIADEGRLTTVETDSRLLTVSPVTVDGRRPWTLVATQPRHVFRTAVEAQVGSPWTNRLLVTVALANFLGLVVLLTLRHWREQITVLRSLAEHDALTNAYSRRFLNHEATMLCRRVDRLGVMMIDVNDFKHHNDTLGHFVGDQMLKATAELLASAVRENDFVIRYGGDEFLLLLPLADDRLVASVEARIRWALEQWNLHKPIKGAQLSLAIGSAAGLSRHLDYLVKQSDERMYVDKQRCKDVAPPAAVLHARKPRFESFSLN